ncbi:tRNA pseudouridine(13) synthase TruD [Methanothermococcus okinawensis]|uniref:Probable tRNA pseudouridine synthase D n=1 Tax=Methanothermococcus okinawensis (strain DSM 14208 / JCM 11175 / IH1) TaxID=647113 RepID=F8ANE7_METOI|nr:tRNA pseudouridine(13) synthase TruD [Methanothermococcus okinawensis]AEH06211.1 tRNA pseudouridine synthase D [Methanothermococcus okinawensis IH1]
MRNYLLINKRKAESQENLNNYRKNIVLKFRKNKIYNTIDKMRPNLNKYLLNLKIEGCIKKYPEDFIVEEITENGIVLEHGKDLKDVFKNTKNWNGSFIHFTLEKINWNTMDAIRKLAKRTGTKRKNFGFAGTKDKFALTTQRVGCFGVKPEKLEEIKNSIKDIKIRDIQKTNVKLRMGSLWGNKFTIRIRLNDKDNNKNKCDNNSNNKNGNNADIEKLNDILKNIKLDYVLNYYGMQRFGTYRPITHIVGKFIYNRDFESAFYTYCGTPINEIGKTLEARKLVDEGDFRGALKIYPNSQYYEKKMIRHYLKTGSYKESFKVLPPQLKSMFVNAYQSYLFNEMINKRYEYGFEAMEGDVLINGIPTGVLIGSHSELSGGIQGEIEKEIIDEENLDLKAFKIEDFGNFPGARRKLIAKVYDFTYNVEDEGIVLRFKMEKGNYATVVLREFIDI